jgi:hypothetical protein
VSVTRWAMPKRAAELPAGINLEFIELRDVNQSGILEAQRNQAAMAILATPFDRLRGFRKQVGRIRLLPIQNFPADGE